MEGGAEGVLGAGCHVGGGQRARPPVLSRPHARRFECGYTLSLDDCEHIYSMWNDAVIDRVAPCDAKATCDELESCEQNVFDTL